MSEAWPDPELIRDFLEEAGEHLDCADSALLELEKRKRGDIQASAQAALRSLHSIKGTAGYVSLFEVQELCHASEGLIHGIEASPEARCERLDLSFDGVSLLRERLAEVARCCKIDCAVPPSAKVAQFLRRASQLTGARTES